mmetsp:Transcript_31822/g.53475  ORF Transcript_31822/g.53475 Transcript_31822/m.53475 type:complete len:319 (-) Transcript_31822:1195-2151(-)
MFKPQMAVVVVHSTSVVGEAVETESGCLRLRSERRGGAAVVLPERVCLGACGSLDRNTTGLARDGDVRGEPPFVDGVERCPTGLSQPSSPFASRETRFRGTESESSIRTVFCAREASGDGSGVFLVVAARGGMPSAAACARLTLSGLAPAKAALAFCAFETTKRAADALTLLMLAARAHTSFIVRDFCTVTGLCGLLSALSSVAFPFSALPSCFALTRMRGLTAVRTTRAFTPSGVFSEMDFTFKTRAAFSASAAVFSLPSALAFSALVVPSLSFRPCSLAPAWCASWSWVAAPASVSFASAGSGFCRCDGRNRFMSM